MNFEKLSSYDLNIRHTANGGIIAKAGCAEFSFSNPTDFLKALTEYYENPKDLEKKYNESSANEVPQEVETSRDPVRGAGGSGIGMGSARITSQPRNEEASERR